MIEMYKTMSGTSCGLLAQNELINWPSAAPSGLANVATAVALVRPRSENQRSLYLVGALRQNGWARPIRIWPNMVTPKMPPFALAPAKRIQLPTRRRDEVTIMAGLGPPLLRVTMTILDRHT